MDSPVNIANKNLTGSASLSIWALPWSIAEAICRGKKRDSTQQAFTSPVHRNSPGIEIPT